MQLVSKRGPAKTWKEERRDLRLDFVAAFPHESANGRFRGSRRSASLPTATTRGRDRLPSSATSRCVPNETVAMTKRVLLAGGGHAHLGVLAAFERDPPPGCEVTLLSPFPRQIYSGMLPGWVAGHYTLDECVIPLPSLATRAGVRFCLGHVARIDLEARIAFTEGAEESGST